MSDSVLEVSVISEIGFGSREDPRIGLGGGGGSFSGSGVVSSSWLEADIFSYISSIKDWSRSFDGTYDCVFVLVTDVVGNELLTDGGFCL